jgi:hypothetical protein
MSHKRGEITVRPGEEWMDEVKAGDILLTAKGKPRLVRKVSAVGGHNYYFYFAIKKCSWTRSCTTILLRGDLRSRGFNPSGLKQVDMSLMDKMIAMELDAQEKDNMRNADMRRRIYSWDVAGTGIL